MSASTITVSRSRPTRYGCFPVGLLLAGALPLPSGAHAAGTDGTPTAKPSQSGGHAVVAQAAKKRCRHGRRAVRRHGRWVCKRVRVIRDVSVPLPPPPTQQAPQQPSQPSITDITRGQAEAWAKLSMAQGRSVNYTIDGCQAVSGTRGFCHVNLTLPNSAVYERYLFNSFVGTVQIDSTYLFEGRYYLY